MDEKMNGKKIKSVWWPDTETAHGVNLTADGNLTLHLEWRFHGTWDESWIIECLDGVEVARYNPRFIESIIWEEGEESMVLEDRYGTETPEL